MQGYNLFAKTVGVEREKYMRIDQERRCWYLEWKAKWKFRVYHKKPSSAPLQSTMTLAALISKVPSRGWDSCEPHETTA